MSFSHFQTLSLVSAAMMAAGCAGTRAASYELLQARQAYEQASDMSTDKYDPEGFAAATRALSEAERVEKENPKSKEAVDKAYVARRKAQIAQTRAAHAYAQGLLAEANNELRRLASRSQRLTEVQSRLSQTEEALEAERRARAEAEARAKETLDQVQQQLAKQSQVQVKEEERGLVITLSGSVLFQSGKSVLLPQAQQRLSQVADALKQSSNRAIVIEGHTDSRGSLSTNEKLAARRAEAVRRFLASRGVPEDRMKSVGIGEERPIASNSNSEGRANNRRVEIVLAPEPDAATGIGGTGSETEQTPPPATEPNARPLQ